MASRPPKRPIRAKGSLITGDLAEDTALAADARCDVLAVVRECIDSRRMSWERKGIEAAIELPCGALPWLPLDEAMLRARVAGAMDQLAERLRHGSLHVALWSEHAASSHGHVQLELYSEEGDVGLSLSIRLDKPSPASIVAPVDPPGRALLVEEHPARGRILHAQCRCLGMDVGPPVAADVALGASAATPYSIVWLGGCAPHAEVRQMALAIRETERVRRFPEARIVALRDGSTSDLPPGIDAAVDWPLSLDRLRALCTATSASEAYSMDATRWLFLRESCRDAAIIREAITLGDWQTVVRHAHRIKGGTVVLGENAVCEQAERVEQAARRAMPNRARLTELLSALEAALDDLH